MNFMCESDVIPGHTRAGICGLEKLWEFLESSITTVPDERTGKTNIYEVLTAGLLALSVFCLLCHYVSFPPEGEDRKTRRE